MYRYFKNITLLVYGILMNCLSWAQPATCFDVNDTVGCTPFLLEVTNCADPSKPDAYDYGDGSSLTFDTTHIYTTPGFYTVTQYVGSGSSIDTLIKTNLIRVVNTPIPTFEVRPCTGMLAVVEITDVIYDRYVINYGDGSPNDTVLSGSVNNKVYADTLEKDITVTGIYDNAVCSNSDMITVTLFNSLKKADLISTTTDLQATSGGTQSFAVQTKPYFMIEWQESVNFGSFTSLGSADSVTSQSFTLNNLNTESEIRSIRINTFDVCGNSILSDTICNSIIVGTPENNQNEINWSDYNSDDLAYYQLYRDNTFIQTISSDTFFIDTDVLCGTEYTYRIESVLDNITSDGDSLRSISANLSLTATSNNTPSALIEFNSTIENSDIKLFWNAPNVAVATYEISRSENGGAYSVLGNYTLTDSFFVDQNVSTSNRFYCYRVSYTDSCGNISDQTSIPETCTMLLTVQSTGENNELTWTPYSGFDAGISAYIVERIDGNNNVVSSVNVGLDTNYTDIATSQITYRIRVVSNTSSSLLSYSNEVPVSRQLKLFIPTAFSPNQDGVNDEFKPVGANISTFKMTIFNQWGEAIYFTEDMNIGWNGYTTDGVKAPEDIYVYSIDVTGTTGEKSNRKGTFTLLH